MSTTAIILAAGKSTRLKSKRPKALHEVCGRPMLDYILQACWDAGVTRAIVVVGHGKDEIIAQFGDDRRIHFVEQTEQLGTGHAAKMAEPELKRMSGDGFVLAGDVPLLRGEVLTTLLRAHRDEKAAASMATAVLDDPTGYGRVVRDAEGNFVAIVEQLDCTPEQREIREVFPSYYCLKVDELLFALSRLPGVEVGAHAVRHVHDAQERRRRAEIVREVVLGEPDGLHAHLIRQLDLAPV